MSKDILDRLTDETQVTHGAHERLRSEIEGTVADSLDRPEVDTQVTRTGNKSNYDAYTWTGKYSRASVGEEDEPAAQVELAQKNDHRGDILTADARASVQTDGAEYATAVSYGKHTIAQRAGHPGARGHLQPKTSVTRTENGEKVTRKIKNPKAAELVAKLAVKKLRQSTQEDTKAA